jgi:hypothetical protein
LEKKRTVRGTAVAQGAERGEAEERVTVRIDRRGNIEMRECMFPNILMQKPSESSYIHGSHDPTEIQLPKMEDGRSLIMEHRWF